MPNKFHSPSKNAASTFEDSGLSSPDLSPKFEPRYSSFNSASNFLTYIIGTTNGRDWTEIMAIPLSELPGIFWNPKKAALYAPWLRHRINLAKDFQQICHNRTNSREKLTPYDTGNWEECFSGHTSKTKGRIFLEELRCAGTDDCTRDDKGRCSCRVKYEIFAENRNICIVSISGIHSHLFSGNPKGASIPYRTREFILKLIRKDMTPFSIEKELNNERPLGYEIITLDRITSLRRYEQTLMFGDKSDPELVQDLLGNLDLDRFSLYPPQERLSDISPDKFWVISLSPKKLLRGLAKHGDKVFAFDGVYKVLSHRYVIWLAVFRHKVTNKGFISNISVTNHDSGDSCGEMLTWLKKEVETLTGKPFDPKVMIDKDLKELNGVLIA
jgi:hypothetical protein